MSHIKDIYERLTGVNLLAEKIATLKENQEKLNRIVYDHEGRLIRIETLVEVAQKQRLPDRK